MKTPTAAYAAALAVGFSLAGAQAFAAEPADARVRVGMDGPQRQYPDDDGRADRAPTPTNPYLVGLQNQRRAEMSGWRRNVEAPRQYHAGAYKGPPDYSYQRYGYGQRLPRDYYERGFWLADVSNFGLLAPPSGFVWVRYGPDAMLIDEETGEIVQVQYNVFYS